MSTQLAQGQAAPQAGREASAHHFSHSPLTLSLAALSESRKTRAPPLTAATLCIARSACIASLVPVLCMMTDYGRCGVHIVQPLRSPVGCVCPQQSKRFKFARAWQPLTRSLTPHPPRTTPVWDPSTLARMQFEGGSDCAGWLACLRQAVSSRWHRGDQQHGWAATCGLFSGEPMQCLGARQPCAHVPSCASCLDYCWGHPQQVKE
jgi:hypothetical protein